MLNLLSKRFSMDHEVASHDGGTDLEAGGLEITGTASSSSSSISKNLERFFDEVKKIKEEMEKVRNLLSLLKSSNEESKRITKAQAMKDLRDRMDKQIREILSDTKLIRSKLEKLDEDNLENRKIPGCEQGSSTDRTRAAITNGLRTSLRDLMQEFQVLRQAMVSEYRETIDRRYYTITGEKADEATLDRMIDTGESESFLQKAVQEQGRGNIIEAIKEIQERHDAVREVEKSLMELHQIFLDMSVLVESQGEDLNNIEATVLGASSFVKKGNEQLQTARKLQKSSRKWTCIAIIILLIIILVIVVPILIKFLPSNNNNSSSSTPSTSTPSPPPPSGGT